MPFQSVDFDCFHIYSWYKIDIAPPQVLSNTQAHLKSIEYVRRYEEK